MIFAFNAIDAEPGSELRLFYGDEDRACVFAEDFVGTIYFEADLCVPEEKPVDKYFFVYTPPLVPGLPGELSAMGDIFDETDAAWMSERFPDAIYFYVEA